MCTGNYQCRSSPPEVDECACLAAHCLAPVRQRSALLPGGVDLFFCARFDLAAFSSLATADRACRDAAVGGGRDWYIRTMALKVGDAGWTLTGAVVDIVESQPARQNLFVATLAIKLFPCSQ